MDLTNQAEQVGADLSESVEEIEPCECNEHRCHLSPPRTIQASIDHLHRSISDYHFCAHNSKRHFLEKLIL